jgi:hypothetical protein
VRLLDRITICARCWAICLPCRCEFGTYRASTVYTGWFDMLKDMARRWRKLGAYHDKDYGEQMVNERRAEECVLKGWP